MVNKIENKKRTGIIALICLTAIFATYGVFARYFNNGFQLFQQVYIRALSAFLIGSIIFYKDIDYSRFKKISLKEWLLIIVRAISLYILGIALVTKAFILSKYGVVSLISVLPFVAILGAILFKEKITPLKAFLIFLSFLGVFLMIVKDYNHLFYWGLGEILALIATFFFALNYVAQKWQSNTLNHKEITQIILFIAFILSFIISLFLGEGIPIINFSFELVFAIFMVGLFNVLGLFLANYGFQYVKAIVANNILNLEVLFAIIIGFVLYKEVLSLKEIVGGFIIIISVVWMNKIDSSKLRL